MMTFLKTDKRVPCVIVELDERGLSEVVGGAAGVAPDLTPGRCPAHQTIDRVTAELSATAVADG
jgi:hypothetical protein